MYIEDPGNNTIFSRIVPPSMKILDTKYKESGIVRIYCLNEREREGTYWTHICTGGQYLI